MFAQLGARTQGPHTSAAAAAAAIHTQPPPGCTTNRRYSISLLWIRPFFCPATGVGRQPPRFGACGAFVLSPDNPRADVRAIHNMFFRLITHPGPHPVERGSILPSKRRLAHTALPRVCAGSGAAADVTSARGRSRGFASTARSAPSALAPMRAPATRSRSATAPQCASGAIEGSGANARGCRTVARSFALLRTSTAASKVRLPAPSPP